MRRYPTEVLWDEIAELGFHLHWSFGDLLDLEHRQRRRLLTSVRGLASRQADGTRPPTR